MSWRAGVLVILALALAGCGGSHPRPSRGGKTVGPRAEGSRGGFSDDISRPQSSRYSQSSDSVPPRAVPISTARLTPRSRSSESSSTISSST